MPDAVVIMITHYDCFILCHKHIFNMEMFRNIVVGCCILIFNQTFSSLTQVGCVQSKCGKLWKGKNVFLKYRKDTVKTL